MHQRQFAVRVATVDDAVGIADVHVTSWQSTYRGHMPQSFLDGLSTEQRTPGWVKDIEQGTLDDFARPTVPGWDRQRMISQVLDPLRAGRPGRYQRWDWATDAGAEWHDVPVGGVVIIEGVSATRKDLSDRWDLTVWVSTPRDVRLERGLARDGEGMRGRWLEVWMPEEDSYVANERPAERADVIVIGT